MSKKYLIGLDAGGGSGRCLIVNVETGEIASAQRGWSHPLAPGTGGWGYDLNLPLMWNVFGELTREALAKMGASPEEVAGISTTSMRHGIVLLDKGGNALLATPNRDARGMNEGMELADARGHELYERTGHWPNPVLAATRLIWLRDNAPDRLKQGAALLAVSEWVGYILTGKSASDFSHAGETLLFDLQRREWAWDIIDSLNLPRALFPKVLASGSKLGTLTADAAAHLGLPAGIPVGVGGGDTQMGLLGSGVVAAGQIGTVAGTTTPVQMVIDRPLIDPETRLWTGQYVIPGLYVLESNAGAMGEAVTWAGKLLYPDGSNPEAQLFAEAALSVPGASGMTSTLGADVFNASALGLPVGTLTLSQMIGGAQPENRYHLTRAIIEGMAYSVRANTDQILKVAGQTPLEMALTGGMTRSGLWDQIVSDTLAVPVRVSATPEGTAYGAAMAAGVAAGIYKNVIEASTALAQASIHLVPRPGESEQYSEFYQGWSEMRETRVPADAQAANLMMGAIMGGAALAEQPAAQFRPRIYVSAQMDEASLARLNALGDVTYVSYREMMQVLSGDDLVEALQNVQVLVTEVDMVDADALSNLPDLRVVISCRGNAVNVDTEACTAFGVPVLNTPGRNADGVADLALAFMLMLARKLPQAITFLHEPGSETGDMGRMGVAFTELAGRELWHSTVGLIGMGAVGRGVVKRLLPFGCRILLYDPYIAPEQATRMGVELTSLEHVLSEADFLSLHATVTPETTGMIGAQQFALMKPGAFLINTARAALIDEDALAAALHSGQLGGAALDVFAAEPPGVDYPLFSAPNVIATPHVGGNTPEVAAHQGQIVADDLGRLLVGQRPRHCLNPATLDAFNWEGQRSAPSAETMAALAESGGPAMSDLMLKPRQQASSLAAPEPKMELTVRSGNGHSEEKKSGFLSGLKGILGGKPSETEQAGTTPSAGTERQALNMLQQIIDKFLADMANDSGLQDFSKGKKLLIVYALSDADIQFYMDFNDGEVRTGMGAPSTPPDLTLKMKADIFDGMMTGRVNATTAAMTGKMKFSGDTSKAMSMQKIQKEVNRLYVDARQAIGDPGDLTGGSAVPAAVAAPSAPVAQPMAARPEPAQAPADSLAARGKMEQIVQSFIDGVMNDPAVQAYSQKADLSLQFVLSDIDLSFYLSFKQGVIAGAAGGTPPATDLTLKMKADIFDGMFTGRINATTAAMGGKIKFSGNTNKAMGMQKIQKDLNRLYQIARDQAGGPGDLANNGGSAQQAAAAYTVTSMPAPAVLNAPLRTGDERDEMIEMLNEMFEMKLITATGGNVSVRVAGTTDQVWVTPSAIFKGSLRPDMMVRVNLDGEPLDEEGLTPSSERRVHTEILRRRPDLHAVIHTHAPWATLLALTETPFMPVSTEAAFLGTIPRVPFIMPGSTELAVACAEAVGEKGTTVLMQNHGLVVAGSSLRRAGNTTEVVERYSELILRALAMGKTPVTISEETARTLQEMGEMMA
jgi:autoinducer 2 (AI-2) kinase